MESIHPTNLLDEVVRYFSEGQNYNKLIAPIILKKDTNGNFDSSELLNRLSYTIVDQQRDVASIIIPIWVNMMYLNVNPEFISESPLAEEFVQSMFKAYGHQNYHTKADLKVREKSGASRTDAFMNVYKTYSPDEFKDFISKNSQDIGFIFNELIKLKFISYKSASFFLRDVEGLEYDILPIDVNIAYSFQYTGLFFIDESIKNFSDVLESTIPVSKRNDINEYSKISDKLMDLSSELDYNPYEINRFLFLLGANFCQSLKCENCIVKKYCYFHNLPTIGHKQMFIEKIKPENIR